jgi:hypothetical protein
MIDGTMGENINIGVIFMLNHLIVRPSIAGRLRQEHVFVRYSLNSQIGWGCFYRWMGPSNQWSERPLWVGNGHVCIRPEEDV